MAGASGESESFKSLETAEDDDDGIRLLPMDRASFLAAIHRKIREQPSCKEPFLLDNPDCVKQNLEALCGGIKLLPMDRASFLAALRSKIRERRTRKEPFILDNPDGVKKKLEAMCDGIKLLPTDLASCLAASRSTCKRPTCKEPSILDNLHFVKKKLEALPGRCIYSQNGCEENVEPGNDHEKFCGYRPYKCREIYGVLEMPVVKVLDHYKEQHSNINIITERYAEGLTIYHYYTPVSLFGHLFWILTYPEPHQLKICFLVTPIGKLNHDYYLRITMENGDFVVTHTLKATESKGDKKELQFVVIPFPDCLDVELALSDENERFCATVPSWQLNLSRDKMYFQEVKFKLFFFSKEKS